MNKRETRTAVLVVDDEKASCEMLRITLGEDFVVHTATSGAKGLAILESYPDIGVAIVDQRMPGMTGSEFFAQTVEPYPHLVRILLTGYTDMESLVAAVNDGRLFRYLTKPWNVEEMLGIVQQAARVNRLAVDNERLRGELREANARLRRENAHLRREAKGRYRFSGIIGSSPELHHCLELVERVAPSDVSVLIGGETGTGKELFARAIHYNGPRADKAFVPENCGAIAPELLTSELFGHKKGAFTSASEDREGLFEVANGGTIFLDEIGDCPADLQVRLLRVLDQGEIRRVGDSRPRKVDVRVIAASNKDLEAEVEAGRFRADLFYRLAAFRIDLPPLRERGDDVRILAEHFLRCCAEQRGLPVSSFTPAAHDALAEYAFPGNVRELQHEVERACLLVDPGEEIDVEHLSPKVARGAGTRTAQSVGRTLRDRVEHMEAAMIREALERNESNQSRTAEELGLSRRGLINKLDRYGLK